MSGNGGTPGGWASAVEGKPPKMVAVAVESLRRQRTEPRHLPECNGEPCVWVRDVAACLAAGDCRAAILFCTDPGLACCVANKVPGIRAVAVAAVGEAVRALRSLRANLLVVEMAG